MSRRAPAGSKFTRPVTNGRIVAPSPPHLRHYFWRRKRQGRVVERPCQKLCYDRLKRNCRRVAGERPLLEARNEASRRSRPLGRGSWTPVTDSFAFVASGSGRDSLGPLSHSSPIRPTQLCRAENTQIFPIFILPRRFSDRFRITLKTINSSSNAVTLVPNENVSRRTEENALFHLCYDFLNLTQYTWQIAISIFFNQIHRVLENLSMPIRSFRIESYNSYIDRIEDRIELVS